MVCQLNEYKACRNEWMNERQARRGCPGTHITEDGEGFGQSVAQQADPFGKQLVQMFPEVLSDRA